MCETVQRVFRVVSDSEPEYLAPASVYQCASRSKLFRNLNPIPKGVLFAYAV